MKINYQKKRERKETGADASIPEGTYNRRMRLRPSVATQYEK